MDETVVQLTAPDKMIMVTLYETVLVEPDVVAPSIPADVTCSTLFHFDGIYRFYHVSIYLHLY